MVRRISNIQPIIFSYLWPTRAYSLIRQQSVFRPTLQETKFIVGKFLNCLWRHRYQMVQKWPNSALTLRCQFSMLVSDVFFHYFHDPPDDEPRIMIRRIIRCSCRKSNKHDGMFCTTAKCKCSRKSTNPGCNVLCACMNRTKYCYQKQQPVEDSFHDLSMQESIPDSIPESPVKRNRMETSSDSSAS